MKYVNIMIALLMFGYLIGAYAKQRQENVYRDKYMHLLEETVDVRVRLYVYDRESERLTGLMDAFDDLPTTVLKGNTTHAPNY